LIWIALSYKEIVGYVERTIIDGNGQRLHLVMIFTKFQEHPLLSRNRKGFNFWNLLLLLPYGAMIFVDSYNRIEPRFYGVPLFYWYQLLWIVLTLLVVAIVYWKRKK